MSSGFPDVILVAWALALYNGIQFMSASLFAFAVLGLARPSIDVTVDSKPGQIVSGIHEFHVRLGETKGIVTQVEFYVNHDLRDTVSSIPYNFNLDTIGEDEGALNIEFRAYSTEGETGKINLNVTIDNQIGMGPEFHNRRARDLLTDSKWDDAILESRLALKAKPGFNPARVSMARAYQGKKSYDRAQKYAEDAVAATPDDREALLLLSSIDIDRAFATFSRGSDQVSTQESIRKAFKSSIEIARKIQDQDLDKVALTADNVLLYADMAIRAGRYTRAFTALNPAAEKDFSNADVVNRLVYCLLREGRFDEADVALHRLKKAGKYNAYSSALEALLNSAFGDDAGAEASMAQALAKDSDDLGVTTARTFLALKRGKRDVMAQLVDQMNQKFSHRNEVKVFLSSLLEQLGRMDEARDCFIEALKADPTNTDAYVQEANLALQIGFYSQLEASSRDMQVDSAGIMFGSALESRPESPEALTGLAVVALVRGNNDDGIKFAKAATESSKSYAAGYLVLSAAYKVDILTKPEDVGRRALRLKQAQEAALAAGKIDKRHLEGGTMPTIEAAWRYFAVAGRTPLLTPPG